MDVSVVVTLRLPKSLLKAVPKNAKGAPDQDWLRNAIQEALTKGDPS